MDLDSPPLQGDEPVSPRGWIVQRLIQRGISPEQVHHLQRGLLAVLEENKQLLPEIILAILPSYEEVCDAKVTLKSVFSTLSPKDLYVESLSWLQWLMFKDDPQVSLKILAGQSLGQRSVCGSIWGGKDLAYRCRTCENDPTCAICVPCFENGNHKDHDYSIMYTGGGCCDCGDITAWKREGFCSRHKGAEMIQPLSLEVADSIAPVLDVLFVHWKNALFALDEKIQGHLDETNYTNVCRKVVNDFSSVIIEILLDFCNCSESLLSFISKKVSQTLGLLELLLRSETFLDEDVVKMLHELLLKFLAEPIFKHDFAKVFATYYSYIFHEMIHEYSDSAIEKYPLVQTFSVQIFTVPTLAPVLVREMNLLDVLLDCLGKIFQSCLEVDGYVQATKWSKLHLITIRLIEDTRYVVSHKEIQMYVSRERPDIFKTLFSLLALIQGMDPQKRITGLHIEEENENLYQPFNLEHYLGKINNLLVEGAFSLHEPEKGTLKLNDGNQLQVANFEKSPLEELCFCSDSENNIIDLAVWPSNSISDHNIDYIPPSVTFLIVECLKSIEKWLGSDAVKQTNPSVLDDLRNTSYSISNFRKRLFQSRNDRSNTMAYRRPVHRVNSSRSILPIHYESSEATSTSATFEDIGTSMEIVGEEELLHETHYERSSSIMMSNNNHVNSSNNTGSLSLTDWPEIKYDVGSQEISFRIPLHRFLTQLLCKLMKICFGEAANMNATNYISSLPLLKCNFFEHILGGFHPYGVSAFLMEHPLRLRVFCAQVRAGMWRRNGDSVTFMSEWYHNDSWPEIGIETDLFLLQCCAALAPSELFVNRVLERFGLSNYLSLNIAEYNEFEPILVQEMLCLIIQIVAERRYCGFSSIDNLQREVVHRLAVGNATHSQLVKALPRDLSKSKQLKNIVDKVALYQSPSSMEQGKYSLRKTYWKELDLYHPRWNLRDLQIAEERFLQASKVSPLDVQLPKWRKIFDPLRTIHRIATSKKVLEIIRAVLFYSVFTETPALSRAPDGVLVTALHLLSLALDICVKHMPLNDEANCSADMPCSSQQSAAAADLFPILMFPTENIDAGMDNASIAWKHQSTLSLLVSLMRKHKKENDQDNSDSKLCNIPSLIGALLKKFAQLNANCMSELKNLAPDVICPTKSSSSGAELDRNPASDDRKAKARERQAAILEKMRSAQSKFMASSKLIDSSNLDTSTGMKGRSHEELGPVCSLCRDTNSEVPLSLLILVQKSCLSTLVDRGPLTWEDSCDSNKEQFVVSGEGSSNTTISDTSSLSSDPISHFNVQPTEIDALLDAVIALDKTKVQLGLSLCKERNVNTHLSLEKMEIEIYQLVQDDIINTELHTDAPVGCHGQLFAFEMDSLKHFQNIEPPADGNLSDKLSKQPLPCSENSHSKTSLTISAPVSFSHFGPVDCDGVHISSCGHAVHQECHDRYLSSLRQRHLRRLGFEGVDIVEAALGELLCPVCRRLANSTLPLFSNDSGKNWRRKISPDESLSCFASSSTIHKLDDRSELLPRALSILRCTSKAIVQFPFPKYFSGVRSETIASALDPFLRKLSAVYCPGEHDNWRAASKLNQSMLLWDTLRYTLVSTEIAARGSGDVYSEGYDELCGKFHRTGYVLSALLQASQAARNVDIFELVLRYRGVQLFEHTICAGLLDEVGSSDAGVYKGVLSSIVEQIDETSEFPPIQFLKLAAAPILAHDPFSSLMWVLFSLPFPFMSSLESFMSLVHLFYNICVIQSLVTCHANHHIVIASYGSCPLITITRMMGETDLARQYFISHYLHDSSNIIDTVRKLTAPYLRRCALLWKLLELSSLSPNSSNLFSENLISSLNDHVSDSTSSDPLELRGISELEKMFRICSMDVIFNSPTVHALALKWWEHLCQVFVVQKSGAVLYLTPAEPFQLMQLPQIYQDLLRRYIKQQCPYCQSVPKEPALCLLCGSLCSFSLKWCCRESRCQSHTASCGSGIGVFLLIRKTIILLQRSGRTAFWPSPYLDAFGEEDRDMARGKPLYLNEKRYTALTNLVASHGLDHNSEVLRMTDTWVI